MVLTDNAVGCDYCEHTSDNPGRAIYTCDVCGADVCSDCSINDPTDSNRVLCSPDLSGCAQEG